MVFILLMNSVSIGDILLLNSNVLLLRYDNQNRYKCILLLKKNFIPTLQLLAKTIISLSEHLKVFKD